MNDQAKLLLSAYRPGGADAADPAFAEALAQAQRDPQLRAWLEESQRFDQAIAGRLRNVAVPENLRGMILAGAKFSHPRSGWKNLRMWAMAALFVVFASVTALWWAKGSRLESWQGDSLAVLDGIEKGAVHFDTAHSEPAQLVEWLNAHAAPGPAHLPPKLAQIPSFGCKTIDLNGRKVSLICFDLGNYEQAHLFTTPRAGLRLAPPDRQPIFKRLRNWNLASWSDGPQVHMLASDIAPEKLHALLPVFIAAQRASRGRLLAELLYTSP